MSRKLVEYWYSRGARCIFVVLTFVFCILVFWYLSNVKETSCVGHNVLIVQYKPMCNIWICIGIPRVNLV